MSKNYKKILVAIDGSEQAEEALKEAIVLAKRDNSQLFVLHATDKNSIYAAGNPVPVVPAPAIPVVPAVPVLEESADNEAKEVLDKALAIINNEVKFEEIRVDGSAKNEIVDRIISTTSNVDSWRIRTGNISNDDFAKIGDALGEMGEIPLYLDDTSSMTILELRNKARRAHHDHNIGLIIVDYLQLITGSDRYAGNRVQEVTEISRGLKILARELEIPVIALAQLSRGVTGRDDPRPVLSDLRESGSIEQDADLVMFLHRVDYYHQEEGYEPTNITELLMAKHRHGAIGKIELYFHPELLRFMNLDKTRE